MNNSEDRLVHGLKNGDEKVFEELFKTYYTPLCEYCMRYVSDADMAEEIVQDLFFKMWVKREELNINVSIKAYIFTSLRNHALNYISRLKIQDRYNQFIVIRSKSDVEHPVDVLEEKDMERIMKQAIAMLPEKRREIFEMSRFEDMKYLEIAEKLNVSVKTVESQMSKALEHMRKVLSKFLALIVTGLFLLSSFF